MCARNEKVMVFIDTRHKCHEGKVVCGWCGQVHKTYIMAEQDKEAKKSDRGGIPEVRLMSSKPATAR